MGIVLFLFFVWKRLKEDYSREVIFGTAFLILIGIIAGYLISIKFFPAWFFWFEGFGAFLGFSVGIFKYNLRFYEAFEAVFFALLPWLLILFLRSTILISLFIFGLIALFAFLDKKYKNFSWYKSGRIGLSGLLTAGVFFVARAAIATFFPSVLSFAGRSEVVLSGISAFAIFLLVYNLARSET